MDRKIKLLDPNAKIPTKAYPFDAGYDVYLTKDLTIPPKEMIQFKLGFAVEIHPGEMLTIRSRSSAKRKGVFCCDSTCDAGYTGQISAFIINYSNNTQEFKAGDRIVQIVWHNIPHTFKLVEGQLSESTRGTRGFGSSGS